MANLRILFRIARQQRSVASEQRESAVRIGTDVAEIVLQIMQIDRRRDDAEEFAVRAGDLVCEVNDPAAGFVVADRSAEK